MKEHQNAILYVRDGERAGAKQAKRLIDQFKGVLRTTPGRGSDKMLMVDYEPKVVGILDMVKYLECSGLTTRRIDL